MSLTFSLPNRQPADKPVVFAVLLLAAFGIVAVFSAIGFLAETKAGGDVEGLLFGHALRIGAGLGAAAAFSMVPYRLLERWSKVGLVATLVLLVAVQFVGAVSGGAQRWLSVGGLSFQPSDFARAALLVHVAALLTRKQPYIGDFKRAYLPLLIWTAPTVLLIGIDDLSSAAVLMAALGAMLFIGRVPMHHLAGTVAVGLVLATLLLLASPQRAARIESYVGAKIFPHTEEVELSDSAEGYQARQAKIAIAMGGLTGVGPGKSVQRDFLPAPYNDFIFAIVTEEYGLIGAGGLLLLFGIVLVQGYLRIARGAPDPFGLFLAVGLTTTIVLYGFVNAAVAVGLFPVTGLPMPFVSYGGSSILATGALVGILLNISRHREG